MKILSSKQLHELDRYTVEHDENLTLLDLVRRVGKAVAYEIKARWNPETPIIIFAGWGNNGADALATAEELVDNGYTPQVFLFNIGGNRLSEECRIARDSLVQKLPREKFVEIEKEFVMPSLSQRDVIIDGLFGSGINRPLDGTGFQQLVRDINESGAFVVSIDIPSGLFGEWNEQAINRNIVHADMTLAIQLPRLSFFMKENQELVGNWKVLNIGLSQEAIKKMEYTFFMIEKRYIKYMLPRRSDFATKADFGNAIIYAGSRGMIGAAVLAAKGCLRAGVGRLTVHTPSCGYNILQTAVPCACCSTDRAENKITQIEPRHKYTAISIGPGLGTADETIGALETFLKNASANTQPVILDADALNCIALKPSMLDYLPVLSVLTPHAGEFDKLFGKCKTDEQRIRLAMEKSMHYNVFIVLKGHYTAIVRPDGRVFFNTSGTAAMATPGSGDVLTGIITALIAQGIKPETATVAAVYIHGLAGEMAEEKHGTYGVTADDIAHYTGMAIKSLMQ